MLQSAANILVQFWWLWVEAAPWLTIGLLAAGLLKAWFPNELVQRWLGGRGIGPVIRAALIGTPLPLCSCSVLPAAVQLHRSGASRGATVSFLIATPENGADSLAMSWALLGPPLTVLRLVSALISSLSAGLVTSWLDRSNTTTELTTVPTALKEGVATRVSGSFSLPVLQPTDVSTAAPVKPCCAEPPVLAEPPIKPCCADPAPAVPAAKSCCGDPVTPAVAAGGRKILPEALTGVKYAFDRLLSDISVWLLIGILTAAVISVFVPANAMASWGDSPWTLLAVLAISVPTYVCATASTPIAASLLVAGLSPGAVLVFLLAGPASNFSSAIIVRRELGSRALAGYLFGVFAITLFLGLLVNQFFPDIGSGVAAQAHQHGRMIPTAISIPIAVALGLRIAMIRIR